jgi:type II secretory pathway component GspD/PulD (secretin)
MRILSDKWLIVSLITVLTGLNSLISNQCTYASEKPLDENVFSLQADNEPMSNVLEKISKATGYKIVLKTDIEDAHVSIELTNVTLHGAIRRIFQNYNHVEIWDDVEKKLELYIWGAKGAPVSISGKKRKFVPTTKTFK